MKRISFLVAVALTMSGCSLFGGDDTTDLSASENPAAQPTPNVVQAVPAEGTVAPVDAAGAPLPTAVTLPATPVPPEPTADRSQPTTYVVQAGDVLGLIAERFDVDIAVLRRENNLSGNLIRVGQELIIPADDGSTTAPTTPTTTGSASGSASASAGAPRATSAPAAPVSCGSSSGYCIQPGDSLLGIASKLGTTVDALRAANPGITGDLIRSGQTLNIPGGGSEPSPTADSGPAPTTDPTTVPVGSDGCPAGYFLFRDGLCYPKPGATATPAPTPTSSGQGNPDYGVGPDCRPGYVLIAATNKCWPEPDTTPATVTPVP